MCYSYDCCCCRCCCCCCAVLQYSSWLQRTRVWCVLVVREQGSSQSIKYVPGTQQLYLAYISSVAEKRTINITGILPGEPPIVGNLVDTRNTSKRQRKAVGVGETFIAAKPAGSAVYVALVLGPCLCVQVATTVVPVCYSSTAVKYIKMCIKKRSSTGTHYESFCFSASFCPLLV